MEIRDNYENYVMLTKEMLADQSLRDSYLSTHRLEPNNIDALRYLSTYYFMTGYFHQVNYNVIHKNKYIVYKIKYHEMSLKFIICICDYRRITIFSYLYA